MNIDNISIKIIVIIPMLTLEQKAFQTFPGDL